MKSKISRSTPRAFFWFFCFSSKTSFFGFRSLLLNFFSTTTTTTHMEIHSQSDRRKKRRREEFLSLFLFLLFSLGREVRVLFSSLSSLCFDRSMMRGGVLVAVLRFRRADLMNSSREFVLRKQQLLCRRRKVLKRVRQIKKSRFESFFVSLREFIFVV